MNCTVCGTPYIKGAAFCSKCGNNLAFAQGMPGPTPMMDYAAAYAAPTVMRTSGMAIAGFVLSFFCGLLGLIFSCIGYSECKNSGGTVGGGGLAIAGIVISVVSMFIGVLLAIAPSHF